MHFRPLNVITLKKRGTDNIKRMIIVSGYTVKPELTATSEQRPPVNNGQHNLETANINLTKVRAPLSNGYFFRVPRVAVVLRFYCSYFYLVLCNKWDL